MKSHIGLHIADKIVGIFINAGFTVYIKKSKPNGPTMIAAFGSSDINLHEIRSHFGVAKVEENSAFYEAHQTEFEIPESSCIVA
jgi:hypothetical protein